MSDTILVIGGRSKIGSALIGDLVTRGERVRALVRPGEGGRSFREFVRDHGACDAYLRESGVPHAVVRPNMFMQNIPENTIPSIDPDGNFYTNTGDGRISMADTRDVAAVAAALRTEPGPDGAAYDVTGPEALSYADVANMLSTILGARSRTSRCPTTPWPVRSAGLGWAPGWRRRCSRTAGAPAPTPMAHR